jgi:hypothetical protein
VLARARAGVDARRAADNAHEVAVHLALIAEKGSNGVRPLFFLERRSAMQLNMCGDANEFLRYLSTRSVLWE